MEGAQRRLLAALPCPLEEAAPTCGHDLELQGEVIGGGWANLMYCTRRLTFSRLLEMGRSFTAKITSPLRMPEASATDPATSLGIFTPGSRLVTPMPTVVACGARQARMLWLGFLLLVQIFVFRDVVGLCRFQGGWGAGRAREAWKRRMTS